MASVDIKPLSVDEFEAHAKAYLPKATLDYYVSGADDMSTLFMLLNLGFLNRVAFQRLKLMPRVLRDVRHIDTSTTVLGQRIKTPVCIAPSAMQRMAHPDGELASTRAASAAGACYILSTISTTSLEDVAAANGPDGLRWFQLYIFKRAGFKALVLTVDTPILGNRQADLRNGFKLPSHLHLGNFAGGRHATGINEAGLSAYATELFDTNLTWQDVAWLKSISSLPVVVKGVLTPEDAVLACDVGCAGILVSNHGARQLDTVPATIEALPAIVAAVQGRAEIYLDGGVRRGTDVFKGQAGVQHVLEILTNELAHAMMFSATTTIPAI
ncbi:hypothetical protein DYB30_007054, partial [Aphanomyces astaci]